MRPALNSIGDNGRHGSTTNWLASFVVGSNSALPMHNNNEKSPSSWHNDDGTTAQLNSLKRSFMRKFPSFGLFAPTSSSSSRGPALTHRRSPSALEVPSIATVRFVLLCGLWYTASALSSNTGKAILTQFRYPVTLTFVQFGFVAGYCLLFMSPLVRFSRFRSPTRAIIMNTLPMGVFQVGGHITSSIAISRIPVSTVHTIKVRTTAPSLNSHKKLTVITVAQALSPLFTVAAYALLFRVSYSAKTYGSLIPLTLGVMLACSFDLPASDFMGLLMAFGSAIIFVTSNIFFKKIMPSGTQTSAHQLDKLNLLFYSSGMALLVMIPIWVFTDLPALLSAQADPTHVVHPAHGHSTPHSALYYMLANGTVHFAQNIVAFIILASTSPVTYSIASLIKRVVVICIAIVWFAQSVHPLQGFGICLTFLGLYMYNGAKDDVEKGETKMRRVEAAREMMLPSSKAEVFISPSPSPTIPDSAPLSACAEVSLTSAYGRPRT